MPCDSGLVQEHLRFTFVALVKNSTTGSVPELPGSRTFICIHFNSAILQPLHRTHIDGVASSLWFLPSLSIPETHAAGCEILRRLCYNPARSGTPVRPAGKQVSERPSTRSCLRKTGVRAYPRTREREARGGRAYGFRHLITSQSRGSDGVTSRARGRRESRVGHVTRTAGRPRPAGKLLYSRYLGTARFWHSQSGTARVDILAQPESPMGYLLTTQDFHSHAAAHFPSFVSPDSNDPSLPRWETAAFLGALHCLCCWSWWYDGAQPCPALQLFA